MSPARGPPALPLVVARARPHRADADSPPLRAAAAASSPACPSSSPARPPSVPTVAIFTQSAHPMISVLPPSSHASLGAWSSGAGLPRGRSTKATDSERSASYSFTPASFAHAMSAPAHDTAWTVPSPECSVASARWPIHPTPLMIRAPLTPPQTKRRDLARAKSGSSATARIARPNARVT